MRLLYTIQLSYSYNFLMIILCIQGEIIINMKETWGSFDNRSINFWHRRNWATRLKGNKVGTVVRLWREGRGLGKARMTCYKIRSQQIFDTFALHVWSCIESRKAAQGKRTISIVIYTYKSGGYAIELMSGALFRNLYIEMHRRIIKI